MLILAEKPSVASAFAAALGVPRKDGFWENGAYCIVNALGHLLEDYSPEDYDPRYAKWKPEDLPIIPEPVRFKPVEKTKKQLDLVKQCFDARRGDELLLATDAEREGEVIGAEILDYAGFTGYDRARRFWVSEALTKEVILAGIENAKPLAEYASYKEQGFARQRADWLAGMNLTRLISLGTGKLLTFGRVQTAVLGAVFDRDSEIAGFKKEKYIEVAAVLAAAAPFTVKLFNPGNAEFPSRFAENDPALTAVAEKMDGMKSGTVTEITTEKKTAHPPQLFNLTGLQKEAHNRFSYSPEQTLQAAQALYEKHKCLSYPRTPSRVMGDENVELVKGVFEKLKGAYPEFSGGTDESLIAGSNKRVFNSAALADHHALIPLGPIPGGASEEEQNVFSLAAGRFFTVFKPDYIYNAVKISVDISGFPFRGSGVEVLQQGWKTEKDEDEDEESEQAAAGIEKNGEYPVSSLEQREKFTGPKKHYTYAGLLSLMENPRDGEGKHLTGLGTPATRGSILKKLVDRNYLSQKGKNILITEEGSFLIGNVRKNAALAAFISIPETTAWEERLHADTAGFIEGVKGFVRGAVAGAVFDRAAPEKESLGKCPLCGKDVFEGKKSFYCSGYKNGPPCKFAVWKEIAGAAVTAADAKLLLLGQKTKPKKCESRAGKAFEAAFFLQGPDVKFDFK